MIKFYPIKNSGGRRYAIDWNKSQDDGMSTETIILGEHSVATIIALHMSKSPLRHHVESAVFWALLKFYGSGKKAYNALT